TAVSLNVITGATDTDRLKNTLKLVESRFEEISTVFNDFVAGTKQFEINYDKALYDSFPVYQNLVKSIQDASTEMPPSGAVAGIYAAVDRDRGVWKAPANVSLASVIGPNTVFTTSELETLNIDVNAGKSINAIRSFTGKGTLIWGARTLAGNDNEWRYVPVRRFYNMVEESIKKSTYWAVFEPNSANTWVKVKGMIENYLTIKWKDGALAGAKPDEAFFVKIGLGVTMSAQDILEGRMNVEIGMAVVRPAEFIILKFSHKLQQS
ncbi:MAG TPA: phage tail sheath C-terminal domain-containing protein, partial [Bacteroidia bacterium]|nr:phage tail sheath C-terminal domain-containing protein [Bacteroidia bacterium]